jgi:predicted phosphohydrolase
MNISDEQLEHWAEYAKRDDCVFVPSDIRWLVGSIMRARSALRASLALGNKIYHNANAHEAPMDWAKVKKLIEESLP